MSGAYLGANFLTNVLSGTADLAATTGTSAGNSVPLVFLVVAFVLVVAVAMWILGLPQKLLRWFGGRT